jgi:hypothetical protein
MTLCTIRPMIFHRQINPFMRLRAAPHMVGMER